jgi:putative CRISPR-associated protein (TIGR02619 family)
MTHQPTFMLTSCGLSTITNYLREQKVMTPPEVYAFSNKNREEIDGETLKTFESAAQKLKNELPTYDKRHIRKLSAELNALILYFNDGYAKNDFHILLHTDTYLGQLAAELVQAYLDHHGVNVSLLRAKDLNTSSIDDFRIALSDLVKELAPVLEGYKENGYEIVFNLTGGFKGSNSFLQTMASLYADKSIYIFETSSELLEIPRLPITLDRAFFERNVRLFRKLEIGYAVDEKQVEDIPKSIILTLGSEVALSPWGELVWQKYKSEFYKSKLVEPISDKLRYAKEFRKLFNDFNPSEKRQINKTLDMLERYLLLGKEYNLSSLRYHRLHGKVAEKYSHELYPFDGKDSRRAFCNEKDGVITIETIDVHLK